MAKSNNQSSKPKSWRDELSVHPAAELFPLMSPDEQRALGEDIMKNGLTSAIALWRADPKAQLQLLDGRNRADGIELVTGKPVEIGAPGLMAGDSLACDKVIVLDQSVDPFAYVISANLHRRHLTAEQRRDVIAELLKAVPEKSNRQIAEMVKASHVTVGSVRADLERRGQIGHVETHTDTRGRVQPATKPKPPRHQVRAAARSEEQKRRQAPAGNGVDPEASANRRKTEAAQAEEPSTESPSLLQEIAELIKARGPLIERFILYSRRFRFLRQGGFGSARYSRRVARLC
jgi:hypothetical protein